MGAPADAKLLEDLALLTTAALRGDGTPGARSRPLPDGVTLERYIGQLLEDPRFSTDVAPSILLPGQLRFPSPYGSGYVLSTFSSPGGLTYYLRKQCEERDVERVRPWWDLGAEVRVCKDSHQPTVKGDPKKDYSCGGTVLTPASSTLCGCGPYLMHCLPDQAHLLELRASARNEVVETVSDLVTRDLPLETLFLANDSVRDRNSEFLYRRWRVAAGDPPTIFDDLAAWPVKATRAPRHESIPGEHAGILTASNSIFIDDAPRTVMKLFYDTLWCTGVQSVNVSTDAILRLGVTDLRQGDGWRKLASMPVCTNCHARLDYGMQFFKGFPSPYHGVEFRPQAQLLGKGPLYFDGIDDQIGEASLSPQGFATLAVNDKRFGECMVSDVANYVFHGTAGADDVRALRRAWVPGKTSLKSLMRIALLRFAERGRDVPARSHTEAPINEIAGRNVAQTSEVVELGAPLLHDVAQYCIECHSQPPRDFHGAKLERIRVEAMLAAVASRTMPKTTPGLADDDRRRMVVELVDSLGGDQATRAETAKYFLGGMRGATVHSIGSSEHAIVQQAGISKDPLESLRLIEVNINPDRMVYTPGFAAVVALRSLAACKAAGHRGEALTSCVRATSAPTQFIIGRP